jgi:uncharacterized membrane protein
MIFTITITAEQLYAICFFSVIAVLLYIYTKDDGEDRLTQIRHDVEMRKEWFQMLAAKRQGTLK